LLVEGRNNESSGVPAALRYAVRVQALGDGKVTVAGDRLQVRGARNVTLLVAAATSFVNFADVSGDPVARVRSDCAAAARKPYAQLRDEHVKSHQALFRRFSIRFGNGQDVRPTNARIASAESQPDPTLAALYVQYARYLLLSCSRPGSEPANLQGLWNEGTNPPWGGKYTININTQMNYWPAGPANLGECFEPVLRMVEGLAVTGAVTARKAYGARGWVTHHNTDLWRASAPIDGPLWGIWPTGGAWLCNTLWDYYDYFRDEAWLRRLYPLLKGACEFFVDTLVEDPQGRGLVTSPSISPENQHHKGVAICAGPAMDRQILRDLFRHTLAAQALLGDDDASLRDALHRRTRPIPGMVGRLGCGGARATAPSRIPPVRGLSFRAGQCARHTGAGAGGQGHAQCARRQVDRLGHCMAAGVVGAHGGGRPGARYPAWLARPRTHIPEYVRRPPAVPDRWQFRRHGSDHRNGAAILGR
jgi:alpha-L-fucosidase 2